MSVYEPLVGAGLDVVSIHIAEGLSGTCASGREAARTLERAGHGADRGARRPHGRRRARLRRARRRRRGRRRRLGRGRSSPPREDAQRRLDIWFCLDTLEYLRKGGRIGAAQSLLGAALAIKPILTFGTEIAPVGRVRTRRRALERMVAYLEELKRRGATEWIVQHAQSAPDAAYLVERGTEILGGPPRFCTQVGPVLGAHLGRGLLVGGLAAPAS